MSEAEDPVIARIQFGALAARLRADRGLEPGEAERHLRELDPTFYATKLTKIEAGTLAPNARDVETMVLLYSADSNAASELRSLAQVARRRATRNRRAGSGSRDRQYIALERQATDIRMVYNEIPGLLQTEGYASAALAASPVVKIEDVPGLARDRVRRGEALLRRGGPQIWAALGEDALYRCSGGPRVLREQLEHLVSVSVLPNVSIRIILRSAGNVAGLSAPFTLLDTEVEKSIALSSTPSRGEYGDPDTTFAIFFDHAWSHAEPEAASLAILEARIADLTTD